MGRSERLKGQRGEYAVRDTFRAAGFDVERARDPGARQLHGDLFGTVPFYVDVKNHASLRMSPWLTKLVIDAERDPRPPLVAFKHGGRWWGTLPLDEVARLAADAERWRRHVVGASGPEYQVDARGVSS